MSAPLTTTRSAAAAVDLPIQIIAPARGWVPIRLREVWEYRELLYFLIWREVKIRYKQAALGIGWAVLQPVLTMVIFSIVFGRFAGLPSDGLPYPVFAFCALLPWQLFTFALTESSNSVVANQRLITKVYFPRVIMPIAAVGVGLLDFAISFIVLLCLIGFYGAYYGLTLGGYVWTVPLWALLAVMTALGVGFWLSALNVKYRDIRYTVPFLAQLWFFATPVVYPTSIVPPEWRPSVRAQSDGGRRRRLPLGAPGEDDRARRDGRDFDRRGVRDPPRRVVLFPAHGTHVRGRDLVRPDRRMGRPPRAMTTKLTKDTKTSPTSVVRFCRHSLTWRARLRRAAICERQRPTRPQRPRVSDILCEAKTLEVCPASCRVAVSHRSPGRRRRPPGQRSLRVLRELRGQPRHAQDCAQVGSARP